jgi:hypothetical protein
MKDNLHPQQLLTGLAATLSIYSGQENRLITVVLI